MTRSPITGEWTIGCYLCLKPITGGSFDRPRFCDYLRELGWRPAQVCGATVWKCPECASEQREAS